MSGLFMDGGFRVVRMNEHIDAGANAITMTALNPDPANKEMPWDLVEAFGQN